MGGQCPTVILANFRKREENVRLSSWQIFKNGRKMSDCHPVKFSKTGGKCLTVILANFQKREEIVRLSSWQIFKNGWKISDCNPGKFSNWEENVRLSSWQIFKNGRKMSNCLSGKFSKMGGKSLAEITSEGGKTTRNKICWVGILLGESSLGSI